jgi:hypothetical protein
VKDSFAEADVVSTFFMEVRRKNGGSGTLHTGLMKLYIRDRPVVEDTFGVSGCRFV